MKAIPRNKPVGNWATLLLPIDEDDRIDFDRLKRELEVITASGVNGVNSNGTAGEFYPQTEDEVDAIRELTVRICHDRGLPFQVGGCHPCPRASLDRVRYAKCWKPSAIQVILPDRMPVGDE